MLSLTLPFGLALGLLTAPGCSPDDEAPAPAADATSGQDASPTDAVPADTLDLGTMDVAADLAAADTADSGTMDVEADLAAADTADSGTMDVAADLADAPPVVCTVAPGTHVIPLTKLQLSAQAQASLGDDVSYRWTVEQPAGSMSVFIPSIAAPEPTFEVNVAGTYTFQVKVLDTTGAVLASCQPLIVQVVADQAIHVELTWDTPADPDQTDEGPDAGADLDLHFLRPNPDTGTFVGSPGAPDEDGDGQPDPYFDLRLDTFWFNPTPDWGRADPSITHDPSLDRDDTDGAGPENLSLANPEDTQYLLAVHYWDDHGFGDSVATVRVYIKGQLAWESPPTTLHHLDMWKVGTLSWPGGVVTPAVSSDPAGGAAITPDYATWQ